MEKNQCHVIDTIARKEFGHPQQRMQFKVCSINNNLQSMRAIVSKLQVLAIEQNARATPIQTFIQLICPVKFVHELIFSRSSVGWFLFLCSELAERALFSQV